MTYNKSKEENRWKQWKKKEEEELRKLGMDEESIKKLYKGDWEEFKSDRRYKERREDYKISAEAEQWNQEQRTITNMQQMLDCVEDELLLKALLSVDKLTLQIILLKMWGYSIREISKYTGLSENSIYLKMHRLRKKFEKLKKGERK